MLLQTNSYIVPKDRKAEHSRLIRRFRQTLFRLGCDHFEVYEQVGSNWSNAESAGRYVQILRFTDRKHQLAVQAAERTDPTAQAVIADFCELINFPYQQQQGLFAVGFYTSVLPVAPKRGARGELVSTVEHEVIDDPEAEKPYPGSSDGPPIEDAVVEDATNATIDATLVSEPEELTEPENLPEDEFTLEPIQARSEPNGHTPASHSPTHMHTRPHAELESLVELEPEEGLELETALNEADEDRAHGFIEGELEEVDDDHHNGSAPHSHGNEARRVPEH